MNVVGGQKLVGELYFLVNKATDTKLSMELIILSPCYNGHIGMQKGDLAVRKRIS